MKTWFITGASRGIGLEVARAALARGDKVVATARDPKRVCQSLPARVAKSEALKRNADEFKHRAVSMDILER